MNRAVGTRLTHGLQLLGILALLVSIIVLFAAADQLGHNRKQITLVDEVSQVLFELRQLASTRPDVVGLSDATLSDAGFGDDIARLIGYADVQTDEISALSSKGLFSREAVELKIARTALVQHWQTAKSSFAKSAGPVPDSPQTISHNSSHEEQRQQFLQLREAFDRVFAAISQDTLSADLLTANSQLLATLKNVDFVLRNRGSFNTTDYSRLLQENVSGMQVEVNRLVSLTTAESGGSLIGYESRQLLSRFATQSEKFKPVTLVEPPQSQLSISADRLREEQQSTLADAIDSASSYQTLLDFAAHKNRRAILFAITALCLALICLVLSLWRSFRNQVGGHISGSPDLEQDLDRMRTELMAIADGNLSVRASAQSGRSLSAIAQAANHTVDMLTGLVQVFRRAGNHLNELAGSQQHLAKRWIRSEIKRHEKLQMLSQNLELQSQAIDQLQEIELNIDRCDDRADSRQIDHRVAENIYAAIQELALKVSACRHLMGVGSADETYGIAKNNSPSSDGVLRMRQRMHELTGTISAVRLAAEQARLQVLNTSLQMTAYAGSSDTDDHSRLVEDIQNISNQLASSAAGAERMSSALADDLQQYADTLASDKHDLLNHFDQLQQSVNICLQSSCNAEDNVSGLPESGLGVTLDSERKELMATVLDNIQRQQSVLQQLVTELGSEAEIVSDADALELLEQIGEIQKVSANLARSAELYGSTANE